MKITGGTNYVTFDFGNGYVIKADGEMLVGRRFVVYKDTMKKWEPPHDNEEFTEEHIEKIVDEVNKSMTNKSVQIIFE